MNTANHIEIITQYVCRNIETMSIIKMFYHSWAFRQINNQRRVWYIVKECRRNLQYCRAFLLYLPAQLLICSGLCPWLCLLWSHSDSRYLNYMYIGCIHIHVFWMYIYLTVEGKATCRRHRMTQKNWFQWESLPRPEKRRWSLPSNMSNYYRQVTFTSRILSY
jgi:hypothetical protein